MTTQFSNTKFQIDAETRMSVSNWQDGERFYGAIAIERKSGNKWSIDHETAVEVSADRDWLRDTRSGFVEAEMYKQETGHVMPMGFYANNKAS